jgi:hypothetical protein
MRLTGPLVIGARSAARALICGRCEALDFELQTASVIR